MVLRAHVQHQTMAESQLGLRQLAHAVDVVVSVLGCWHNLIGNWKERVWDDVTASSLHS